MCVCVCVPTSKALCYKIVTFFVFSSNNCYSDLFYVRNEENNKANVKYIIASIFTANIYSICQNMFIPWQFRVKFCDDSARVGTLPGTIIIQIILLHIVDPISTEFDSG